MYTGPGDPGYHSNIPPWNRFVVELRKRGLTRYADQIERHLRGRRG
jgi:hypothetical protein